MESNGIRMNLSLGHTALYGWRMLVQVLASRQHQAWTCCISCFIGRIINKVRWPYFLERKNYRTCIIRYHTLTTHTVTQYNRNAIEFIELVPRGGAASKQPCQFGAILITSYTDFLNFENIVHLHSLKLHPKLQDTMEEPTLRSRKTQLPRKPTNDDDETVRSSPLQTIAHVSSTCCTTTGCETTKIHWPFTDICHLPRISGCTFLYGTQISTWFNGSRQCWHATPVPRGGGEVP